MDLGTYIERKCARITESAELLQHSHILYSSCKLQMLSFPQTKILLISVHHNALEARAFPRGILPSNGLIPCTFRTLTKWNSSAQQRVSRQPVAVLSKLCRCVFLSIGVRALVMNTELPARLSFC